MEPWSNGRYELGEGPVWSDRTGSLYWVDIFGRRVHKQGICEAVSTSWSMPSRIGCVVEWGDALIVALANGLHKLDENTGDLQFLVDPEWAIPANRLNDGKCDPQGRFWFGSTRDDSDGAHAGLYRMDLDGSVVQVLSDVTCSNGLGWSPDGRTMYYTDTGRGQIDAFDYDVASGEATNRRHFASEPTRAGVPDGLTVDAEGCVWGARWDDSCVIRYWPDGTVRHVLELPVRRPTSCTFGGRNLDQLYVTSAAFEIAPDDLTTETGAVLLIDPGVRGLPTIPFGGPVDLFAVT